MGGIFTTLEPFVKAVLDKVVAAKYPHVRFPAVVFAQVVAAAQCPETFEVKNLIICNDENGHSYQGRIVCRWYEYKLAILDAFGSRNESFPIIPKIRSKLQFETGAVVAVAFPYGDLTPAIIGEVAL